jgi:hypothetical protein
MPRISRKRETSSSVALTDGINSSKLLEKGHQASKCEPSKKTFVLEKNERFGNKKTDPLFFRMPLSRCFFVKSN